MWKVIWLSIYFAVLIWSAIEPKSYFIWILEVGPALIGLTILVLTYKKFHYDRVGHLAQGFIPAIIAREILIRRDVISGANWRNFIIVSICLAFSAFYELIEWWVAVLTGSAADDFLATQGDIWDTQSDMALALTGAILALLLLSKLHDRQLARVG